MMNKNKKETKKEIMGKLDYWNISIKKSGRLSKRQLRESFRYDKGVCHSKNKSKNTSPEGIKRQRFETN